MPTYEYQCKRCAHHFELFQKISEKPVQYCPRCNGPVQRLIGSGAGFIFKGSGFYITDYRSKEYKEKQKAEKKNENGPVKKEPGDGSAKPIANK